MSSEINPYAPPQAEASFGQRKSGRVAPGRTRPFEAANGPGHVAMVLIGVAMLVELAVIAFRYVDLQMVDTIINGEEINQVDAIQNEARILMSERGRLLAIIVTAVPFFMWIYRSHRNLPALLATPLNYSPGWTIGGWFIPVGNLFIPYQVVQEIHRGSDPAGLAGEYAVRLGSNSVAVMVWWFCWISCGILTTVGTIMLGSQAIGPPDLEMLRMGAWIMLATSGLRIGAGVSIMLVMRTILQNQLERAVMVERGESTTPNVTGIEFVS